ncbi:uncharacterized protein LOC142339486 isoform X3 [Convolutriloba macropyga]|uniref:uncharacterized protein LOC142339486 isoform X3 n=1 Tax=Convolutriloba macropyga TaxID=536237 RepID=UPI003F520825
MLQLAKLNLLQSEHNDRTSIDVFVYFQTPTPTATSDTNEEHNQLSDTKSNPCEQVSADWVQLNQECLPVQIVCTQAQEVPPIWQFHVSVENPVDNNSLLLDCLLTSPGTNLERSSSTFVEWKDKGSVWGLGFGSEKDALRFLSCCTPPNFVPSRQSQPLQSSSHSSSSSSQHQQQQQQTTGTPVSGQKRFPSSSDRPKSVSNMEHFSLVAQQQSAGGKSKPCPHNSQRPHIVPVQKPLSRPIQESVSSKRPGMSPVMGGSAVMPGAQTQPSTPMKVPSSSGTRQHHKDLQQVHIMPSGGHSFTSSAIRMPEETPYSSITVVPGASQAKRPLMHRSGARVNMQLIDQESIRKCNIPEDKLLAALGLQYTSNITEPSIPTSIIPQQSQISPHLTPQNHPNVPHQKVLPAPLPPRTRNINQQGFYENTGDALYSEIFTIHQYEHAFVRQPEPARVVTSADSSPTESVLMTPEIHDLMTHTIQAPDNCQDFGGIPTLLETDLEEIGETESPSDDEYEFQKTLFFPTSRRCRLSQADMNEFDPLRCQMDRGSQEVAKLSVDANLSTSVTLEDISIKADQRNSILSQTDSGFDGGNCAGSATSEQSVRNSADQSESSSTSISSSANHPLLGHLSSSLTSTAAAETTVVATLRGSEGGYSAVMSSCLQPDGEEEPGETIGVEGEAVTSPSSPVHLPNPSEYINVQWPARGSNVNSNGSSGNSGSLGRSGGCPEPRKPSIDHGSLGGGIGPGVNEEEKLRNFVENSLDLPTDDTQSEISEDNFSIPSNNTSDNNAPSPLNREAKSESSVTSQFYYGGITRKAGWLEIKHILFLRKKRLEAAPKRKWHKYWSCLRGVSLLFYSVAQGEQPAIEDTTQPACTLNIENCIGQAIPEHPKKENIFSLSTANGDVYLLEAPSQIELENWITAIHSSCSSAFALGVLERLSSNGNGNSSSGQQQQRSTPPSATNQKPQDTLTCLRDEIRKREDAMDRDSKMRKMAQLQLSVTVDSKNRQPILAQIENWEQNLELMQCDLYRLKCYCASIQGSELPNPKGLLAAVSKDTKTHLAKLNCFNVSSIHALLSARSREVVDIAASSSLERSKKKPSMLSVLRPKEGSGDQTCSGGGGAGSSFQRNMKRRSWRQKDNDEPIRSAPADETQFPFGFPINQLPPLTNPGPENNLFGRLIKVSLPHNQKTVIPIKPGVTVHELLIHCCKKRKLDPRDHFIRIKTVSAVVNSLTNQNRDLQSPSGENNSLGLKWVIPPYKAKMDDLDCRDIQLCIKEYHSMQLLRRPHERFGIEYETMQECAANELRLYVVDVIYNSIAQLGGLVPGDELIEVNGQNVATVDPGMLDMILKTDQLNLVVRSMRPSTAPCLQCNNAAAAVASGAMMLGAGHHGMHGIIAHSDHHDHHRRSQISETNSDQLSSNGSSSGCGSGTSGTSGANNSSSKRDSRHMSEHMTSPETYKLACTLQELLNSEEKYIKDLDNLLEKYLEPLANTTFLHSSELLVLAKNTRDILTFQQQQFFSRLHSVLTSQDLFTLPEISSFQSILVEMCEVFSQCVDGFKMYSSFCANHSKAQKVFDSSRTMPEFLFFLERTNPENEHSKSLESYLIKPIQRILKYPLLLREVKAFIPENSPEQNALILATNHMESVAELINDMKRIHEEYGSIFDDLLSEQRIDMNCDIPMDELQMYGSAIWLNCPEEVIPKKIRIGNGEIEVIIFVFKRAIVLVGYNREKNRGKKRSMPSKESKFEEAVSNVQFLVPVSAVEVHGSVNREQDRLFLWDLVVHRGTQTQVLRMASRALNTKESFLRAIRTSIRENHRLNASKTRRSASRVSEHGAVPRSLSQSNYNPNASMQPYNNVVFNTDCDTPVRRSQSPGAHQQPPNQAQVSRAPSRTQSSISPERFANLRIKPTNPNQPNPQMLQTQLSTTSNQESGMMYTMYDVSPVQSNSSSSSMSWTNQSQAVFSAGNENKAHQADSGIFSDDNEHSMNTILANTLELFNPRQ